MMRFITFALTHGRSLATKATEIAQEVPVSDQRAFKRAAVMLNQTTRIQEREDSCSACLRILSARFPP